MKKKILIIGMCPWGLYQRMTPFVTHLAKKGFSCVFVNPMLYSGETPFYLNPGTKQDIPEGVRVIERKSGLKRGATLSIWQNLHNIYMIHKEKPDYVIFCDIAFCFLASLFCRLFGIVSTLDYIDDYAELPMRESERFVLKNIMLPIMTRVVNFCMVTGQVLGMDLKKYTNKILWIPNGVGEYPERLSNDYYNGNKIVFTGFIDKRIDIEYLGEIARRLPNSTFIFAGGGDCLPTLLEEVKDLENVKTTGTITHEQSVEIIKDAGVCLIPYKRNRLTDRCLSIKLMEYWAQGKIAVALETLELSLLKDAPIINVKNSAEAAGKITAILTDEMMRREMGKKAHELIMNQFNYNALTDKYIAEIRKIRA